MACCLGPRPSGVLSACLRQSLFQDCVLGTGLLAPCQELAHGPMGPPYLTHSRHAGVGSWGLSPSSLEAPTVMGGQKLCHPAFSHRAESCSFLLTLATTARAGHTDSWSHRELSDTEALSPSVLPLNVVTSKFSSKSKGPVVDDQVTREPKP